MKEKVAFTNQDKILFPKSKITKGDIIAYYRLIAKRMVPLMKDRPVSMLRYPNGIAKEGFFQKNVSSYFPKWIKTCSIPKKKSEKIDMVLCNDANTLLYLANQGCITPHIWLSKKDKLRQPDRLIFDLDPAKGASFPLVIEGAKALREILENECGLKTFLMTTGSRGLHVVVPIKRKETFKEVRSFASDVAKILARESPGKFTVEKSIQKRGKRVFIDYLRNGFAQTGVAPYAVRAIEGAPVALPISWRELKAGLNPQGFHIKNIKRRLTKDPWEDLNASAKPLKAAIKKLEKLSI